MLKLLSLVGIGAGAAYLLDREKGQERREQLRGQMVQLLDKADQNGGKITQDSSSPVSGIIRGARSILAK